LTSDVDFFFANEADNVIRVVAVQRDEPKTSMTCAT